MIILNTLSGKKEEFEPINGKNVGMFVCGPTVYDYSHIGHARTYIIFDIIAKYFRHKSYKVEFIMNITDIDDKIISRAKEENKDWKEISEFYEKTFMEDMKVLNIDSVSKFAEATGHIKEIIKQINILIEKGCTYQNEDGVYFDISQFEDYGKLAKRTVQQAEDATSRIDESIKKKNRGDFALWRLSKEGEPAWDFETGKYLGITGLAGPAFAKASAGKPGWHIEDTAISEKYLGEQYDIHGGAQDLIFPHHEAEIAEQESASGKKPFVKYWLHSGFVTINGKKMSKSLGNFVTISNVLKDYSAQAIRFMIASVYYRSPIDYKEDLIKQSEAAIQRIRELMRKLEVVKKLGSKQEKIEMDEIIKNTKTEFESKMDDDFNTPEALAVIFNFIRLVNASIAEDSLDRKSAAWILKFFSEVDQIFGIVPSTDSPIPDSVLEMVLERERLRKEKAWLEADKIRDELQNLGYSVEDTQYGPLVRPQSIP